MRKFLGSWRPWLAAAAAVLLGGSSMLADGGPISAADEIQAIAGGGEAGIAVNVFSPASLVVNPGDTVTWTNPYTEPHSVSYLAAGDTALSDDIIPINPEAAAAFDGSETFSSGLFASAGMFAGESDSFSVTFETTGSYTFFCSIHPGMEVDVTVVTGINPPPVNEDAIAERIEEGLDLGYAAVDALVVPGPQTNAAGKKTWTIPTPPTVPYKGSFVDVLRFTPQEVNIGTGDTVTWENTSFTPHTVTFFVGPPPAGFSPFVPDVSSTNYEPGTFLNSGIYVSDEIGAFLGGVGETFSLTFNTPGTYQYVCALHADSGMTGVINVGGAGGGITPPSTGDAGLLDQSSGAWMMFAGVALLLSSFVAGALVVVRKDA